MRKMAHNECNMPTIGMMINFKTVYDVRNYLLLSATVIIYIRTVYF